MCHSHQFWIWELFLPCQVDDSMTRWFLSEISLTDLWTLSSSGLIVYCSIPIIFWLICTRSPTRVLLHNPESITICMFSWPTFQIVMFYNDKWKISPPFFSLLLLSVLVLGILLNLAFTSLWLHVWTRWILRYFNFVIINKILCELQGRYLRLGYGYGYGIILQCSFMGMLFFHISCLLFIPLR